MLHRRAAQGTQTPRRGEKTQPIFRTIFGAMMLVLVAEILLLVISIYVTNVGGRLNQNAKDMLAMQVRNRVGYMQDLMQNAQDLTDLSDYIDRATLSMVNTGRLDLDALNTDSEQSSALLAAIAPELVNTLRARSVTGIFVVLNTEDLRLLDVGSGVPGIYLRDLDPDARPSEENADLLIERGSAAVVKALGITTDKSWQPVLRYYGLKGRGFFKEPFLRAYEDNARLSEEYYGRWTTSAYTISDDDRSAIAYSQPLILPDGTVYGVVGVELLTSYVQEKMPYEELQNEKSGAYFLVSTTADEDAEEFVVSKLVTSSQDSYALEAPESMMRCERRADGCWLNLHKRDYYAVAMPISLYSRNAPFSEEHWLLIGAVNSQTLFAFAQNVRHVLTAVVVGTLVLGMLSSLLIAHKLARPVELLYYEVVDGQEKKKFPELSHTKIRELDRLADALTSLNSELLNNSTKFLRIMDMASVELGGYELRRQMVIEITEEEAIDREAMETKRHAPGFSGMFALDDYGSGYSNEGSLLELSPRFIKVDLTIIRGIDTDPDKQQIVQNIVAYAHPRSMQIIAEGVETAEELKKVLELGVDGLQGYFLAKPANIPARIAPAARQIIENSHSSDCG